MRDWVADEQLTDAEADALRAAVPNPIAEYFVSADNVRPEKTSYLWFPYLVQANVNILGGKPNTGKTWFICALMTAISRGNQPREMAGTIKRFGRCIYLGGEDGNGVIAERLEMLGGRTENVILCEKIIDINGKAFADMVTQYAPVLVVIDPLPSYMPEGTNCNDPVAAKQFMDTLRDFAREHDTTVLAVVHPPKKEYPDLLDRFMGSGGYVAGARTASFLSYHPSDGTKRVGIQPKNNSYDTDPFVFELDPDAGFLWAGEDATITAKLLAEAERVSGAKGGKLRLYANVMTEVMRINPDGVTMTAREILEEYSKLHAHEIDVKSFGQMLNKDMFSMEMDKAGYHFQVASRAHNVTRYACYDSEILRQVGG